MVGTTNPSNFGEIVPWASSTFPQNIREPARPPGIQVVDEPPWESPHIEMCGWALTRCRSFL